MCTCTVTRVKKIRKSRVRRKKEKKRKKKVPIIKVEWRIRRAAKAEVSMEKTAMTTMEVKLFGAWLSPFVRRVEWALKIKGIKYEYIEEDLCNKSPSLLEYSPINKQVPVLLHDGKPIIESMVIIEYIDDTWKLNPILPEDPYQRAMARFWAQYVEDKFYESIKRAFFTEREEQNAAVETALEALKPLERELKGKKFFGGEHIGFVDLVAGWIAHWLGVVEEVLCIKIVDPENFPSLCAWMKDFVEVPVIQENLPARDQMPGSYRMLRQSGLAS